MMTSLYRYHWFLFLILLISVFFLYYPASGSNFLLDDLFNLRDLADIRNSGYLNYIFSGETGPGGRPVALLSFALQADQWPDPVPFKLVNLLNHLLNGVLVYMLCRWISEGRITNKNEGTLFCLLVAGLWVLQPMHLTTVFYVVQRMTLLATTFMLCGILLYLRCWKTYMDGNRTIALAGLAVCYGILMPLAVFTKEIGILTGLYIFILYFTLSGNRGGDRLWHTATLLTALVPVIAVLAWLLLTRDFTVAYANRPFTMYERLITEAGVLFNYIRLILLPVASKFSIFHDDYIASTSLFSPPWTFISVLAVPVLIAASLVYRKKFPVPAFAVLWFFGGHILESGFIPLELYFEHRNYLPSFGLILFSVWVFFRLFQYMSSRAPVVLLIVIYSGLVLSVTLSELDLWSKPLVQAYLWKENHPRSLRALNNLWNMYIMHGELDRTDGLIREYRERFPHDLYPVIRQVYDASCRNGMAVDEQEWEKLTEFANRAEYNGKSIYSFFSNALYNNYRKTCRIRNPGKYARVVEIIAGKDSFKPVRGEMYELAASFSVLAGDVARGLDNINRAIWARPTISNKIFRIRILIALGRLDQAREMKSNIEKILDKDIRKALIYKKTLDNLVIAPD